MAHEIGHAIMDDVYEDAYPATPSCSGHKVDTASSAGCAWTEGFADWLPLAVYGWKVRSGRIARYKLRRSTGAVSPAPSAGVAGPTPGRLSTVGVESSRVALSPMECRSVRSDPI